LTEPSKKPESPPRLSAKGVVKHYGHVRALDGVSMDLVAGEIHGLCGHNGAGKSTLVKIVTGLVEPDSGTIEVDGAAVAFSDSRESQAAGVALVDQELSLAPDLSVEENIFLGSIDPVGRRPSSARRERARELLSQVGLSEVAPQTIVAGLALGERQLVEIARALGRDSSILLLDEPTATLSDAEIERVFEVSRRLAAGGTSIVYISHRLGEVLEICDRVTVIRDGKLVDTRSTAEISGREELIRMMIDAELPVPTKTSAVSVEQEGRSEIRALSVPPLVKGFELSLRGGELVGLTGQVGSGPSEVLRALAGLEPDARGVVVVGGRPLRLGSPTRALRAGIGYASNDRKGEGVFLQQTVRRNLLSTRLKAVSPFGVRRPRLAAREAERIAGFVGVDRSRLPDAVENLSGGNQQKVFLGRCLDRGDITLLLLDEPTRGVDVGGRAEIHELLREAALAGVTVVFASTELDEILELSDRVVTMFEGRIVATRDRSEVTAELLSADMTMGRESRAGERAA
jgi:ABC-type sugar transport system ATPase subunit